MRVLFVCTANVCRSPMAAGLLVQAASERGVSDVLAASAGFLEGGQPVHEHVAEILRRRRIDTSRKRSQPLSTDLVEKSDLILTMTCEHARSVVGRFPDSLSKVYTFRHFGTIVSPREPDMSASQWLDELHRYNKRAYLSNDAVLDIPDPIGHDSPVFEALADEMSNTISWIMDCAYSSAQARTA